MKSFERAFEACRTQTFNALENGYDVKAILWHQGETDYFKQGPANYYDNLKILIAHMRQFIYQQTGQTAALSLPFILGTVPHVGILYNAQVEAAQKRVAQEDDHVFAIDLSEVSLQGDGLHFDVESGRYFANQVCQQLVALGICKAIDVEAITSPSTLHPSPSTLYTLSARPATAGHHGIVVQKGQKWVKR